MTGLPADQSCNFWIEGVDPTTLHIQGTELFVKACLDGYVGTIYVEARHFLFPTVEKYSKTGLTNHQAGPTKGTRHHSIIRSSMHACMLAADVL